MENDAQIVSVYVSFIGPALQHSGPPPLPPPPAKRNCSQKSQSVTVFYTDIAYIIETDFWNHKPNVFLCHLLTSVNSVELKVTKEPWESFACFIHAGIFNSESNSPNCVKLKIILYNVCTILVFILTDDKRLATAFLVQDNSIQSHSQIHLSRKELKDEGDLLPAFPCLSFFH